MAHSRVSSADSFKSFSTSHSASPRPTSTTAEATVHTEPSPPSTSEQSTDQPVSSTSDSRLPSTEEASLLAESNTHKATGNSFFATQDFSTAIQTYDKALGALPDYLDYEIAVLRSNIAACHLKLEEWKEAVESASKAAERLDGLVPLPKAKPRNDIVNGEGKGSDGSKSTQATKNVNAESGQIEEIDDSEAEAIEQAMMRLNVSGHTHDEVQRLRIKVLLRRAKARTQLSTWTELAGAEEDYSALLRMPELTGMDRKTAEREVRLLKPRLEESKTREMQEMMGKLKDMGNGILKPFGLSTDMFNFVKDEKTGGYSMNFGKSG